MLDLKFIRDNADSIKEKIKSLYIEAPIDAIIELDDTRRTLIKEGEELKNIRNIKSKEIASEKDNDKKQEAIAAMKEVSDKIKMLDDDLRQVEEDLNKLLLEVPNMPDDDVPLGKDDSENVIVKTCGDIKEKPFKVKPHWELGESLDIIDFERGVKISGTRFYILKGLGARLQRALITWMIDLHLQKHGYTEVYPPAMVKRHCMTGTGQLPKFGENLYVDEDTDTWFAPTAEVPVTNMYMDEILDAKDLPIKHAAYTPCFRKEKMSAGKDTRGIKRGHQFDKVEMVKFVLPEASNDELNSLISNAEDVLKELKLPYRIVQMCTGDLSFTACKKFDLEAYAYGCAEWLEVSSCSNFRDFQARRANIKFRRDNKSKPELVHTLNGSGLALPRIMISIIENYQNQDGSISIPKVLIPYMGGIEKITK
ncbi:MAG: serine--tRNA ligase [Armatimonadota bacterium]